MSKPSRTKTQLKQRAVAKELFGLTKGRTKETLDQRAEAALVLSLSPDEEMRGLAQDALSPLFERDSLAALVVRRKLNYHQVAEEYKAIKRSEGFMRAARHLPDIMEQTAVDSKAKWDDCPDCNGLGQADGKGGVQPCKRCKGKGLIYIPADIEKLKLIFNTFGLTSKDGGGVNVNLDLRKTAQPETMHDLSASLSGIIEGAQK